MSATDYPGEGPEAYALEREARLQARIDKLLTERARLRQVNYDLLTALRYALPFAPMPKGNKSEAYSAAYWNAQTAIDEAERQLCGRYDLPQSTGVHYPNNVDSPCPTTIAEAEEKKA